MRRLPRVRDALAWAATRLAPTHAREVLYGDLLEEHAAKGASQTADQWLLRECLRSVPPLLAWRMARTGRARLALALTVALAVAALVHATGHSLWHAMLGQVPLRALRDAPLGWRLAVTGFEIVLAILVAAIVIQSTKHEPHDTDRPGGRR